jgi:TetR/AcrR family transcriptional regulator, transcriptional repressor for nem operon
VAQQLIHERGFGATSLADILAASGAGSSSLYHYFRSKEALLEAVLDRLQQRLDSEILGPVRAQHLDPVASVFAVVDFYRRFLLATEFRLGCPVGNLAGELADSHPAIRARLASLFAAWQAGIGGFLQPAAARLRDGVTVVDLASFVLTVIEGAVMLARVSRTIEPFDRAVAMLRDWFDRILPPTEKPT